VAQIASEVVVFQRTPAWVTPRHDRAYSRVEKRLFAKVPGLRELHRGWIYARKEFRYVLFEHPRAMAIAEQVIRRHIRKQVPDPELAARLMPDYRMGCKRILVSDDYYPALAQPHVELVTARIDRVEADQVVTTDGAEHELDVIVWATGFDILNMLGSLDVTGVGGRDLRTTWDDTLTAHLGMTVPGFPNLFMLLGPNTGLGHNSVVIMIESQLNYVMDAIAKLRKHDAAYVDVTPEALAAWEREVAERTRTTVWAAGCDSWYLGEGGYNFTLWPGSTIEYRQRVRRFDVANYRVVRRDELPERVAAAAS
jgi:cation diffusion facilitator CzcD-associated flavoprotein CzcO